MAYNFLGLVNDLNSRVNEVQLTSANFNTAVGYYSMAKEAVNSSIRYINQDQIHWPFNHTTYDETLIAGTNRYAFQSDAKTVNFNSFRLQRNDTFGNETISLRVMNYDEYLRNCIDDEYNTDTGIRSTPKYVAQTPDQNYVIYPIPDEAYTLTYEYYALPVDLSAATDVPSLPEAFRSVIVDGAMYYALPFRGDLETSDRMFSIFKDSIANMRKIYINRPEKFFDTRIVRPMFSRSSGVSLT